MKGFIGKCWLALCLMLATHLACATVTYVYTDPQGTPLAEANASGVITATFDYSPYGRRVMGNPTPGPGYTGHVEDPDTSLGLIYMQARYYDPVVGRFLSVDPMSASTLTVLHFSRYPYAYNNPIANSDPDGKCPWCAGFIAGAVVEIIAQKIVDPGKDINWKSVGVSAVAGAVTGGIASIARAAAIRGTVSVAGAVARTAVANAVVSGAASAADSVANNEKPSATKILTAAAIGGVTSAAVGGAGARQVFAEKIEAAAVGTPAGIGAHIAAVTDSASTQVAVGNAAITAISTVASENAPDVASSVVDKKIEERIDKN